MPWTALALVLGAAFLHAVWNISAKKAGGDHRFVLTTAILVVVVWSPLALWFGREEVFRFGAHEWLVIGASAVVHVFYFNILLTGYRLSDLTVVYPVARGSAPLLSACCAPFLFDEPFSASTALGVAGVCGGVFLVAGGPSLFAAAHDPARRARTFAGLRWGALTGVFIAGYTLIDGYAVKDLGVSPVLVDYCGNFLRLPFLLPLALRDPAGFRTAWRAQWKHGLVVAVIGPLAYVMVLYAARLAPLSHVAPAREVSMLFAAILGGKLLGEGERGLRFLGAACIAGGVATLALG
jgi:drug/metabolite transporter (DMT)-like permease